ncbi:nucleotidyltransferase domain-containing protein [Oscillatoria sp. FACHB-1406]|uniref:nucleotidyltransferase domain-containing protein n=1 Tax=Oscillatoria sp. FACHB-1406 TaxID=2692846 RepID=UPI0016859C75|nr:nucleotidyltransferase domain-containing protein [Oscillatoria sp. FACHB-1406]MBD2578163.1 nucleotidyltransferase domain-containing protein [Oscillatoria sp. FACHB-1406]
MHIPTAQLLRVTASQPYPLLFASLSGAHLYGFPSPDSDFDLRGSHLLPLREIVGLYPLRETIEVSEVRDNTLELDLVTHDVKKLFEMLLKKNGYVLEQIFSPLVLHAAPEYEELKAIAKSCITRYHSYHYLGFARTQWRAFQQEDPPRLKPLLYVYRTLLTGIHLMQTGDVNANLIELNEEFKLSYISELVARKLQGQEQSTLASQDIEFHQREYEQLQARLQAAAEETFLPVVPSAKAALHDLLVRLRLS